MKRIILFSLIAFSLTASSQRRRIVEPVFDITPEEAMAQYDFDKAEEILNAKIEYLTKKKQPTEHEDSLLVEVEKAKVRLQATESVTFIDSLVIPKEDLISKLRLGSESGSIETYTHCFHLPDTLDCTVFMNQLANHRIFGMPVGNGLQRLFGQELIGSEWTDPKELRGLELDDGDIANYPFMLSDGITLYYAAKTEESLGGYDIYMTRYDADEHAFLSPENIGMPFNSPANDYLFAIDEYNNLGYFVTDRNQPEGKVCLYTFIPNNSRRIYNQNEIGIEMLRNLARINSIRDTWSNREAVKQAIARLENVRQESKNSDKPHDFDFILNDKQTYTSASEFKNSEAKQQVKFWMESKQDLATTRTQLENLRDKYATASNEQKQQFAPQIRILEGKVEQLTTELKQQEKQIRELELNK